MQPAVFFQPFDGRNLLAGGFTDRRQARAPGASVNDDGAGPALSLTATILCSGKLEIVAQGLEKGPFWLTVDRELLTVDLKLDAVQHFLWGVTLKL